VRVQILRSRHEIQIAGTLPVVVTPEVVEACFVTFVRWAFLQERCRASSYCAVKLFKQLDNN